MRMQRPQRSPERSRLNSAYATTKSRARAQSRPSLGRSELNTCSDQVQSAASSTHASTKSRAQGVQSRPSTQVSSTHTATASRAQRAQQVQRQSPARSELNTCSDQVQSACARGQAPGCARGQGCGCEQWCACTARGAASAASRRSQGHGSVWKPGAHVSRGAGATWRRPTGTTRQPGHRRRSLRQPAHRGRYHHRRPRVDRAVHRCIRAAPLHRAVGSARTPLAWPPCTHARHSQLTVAVDPLLVRGHRAPHGSGRAPHGSGRAPHGSGRAPPPFPPAAPGQVHPCAACAPRVMRAPSALGGTGQCALPSYVVHAHPQSRALVMPGAGATARG